jgi:hypothetical protein
MKQDLRNLRKRRERAAFNLGKAHTRRIIARVRRDIEYDIEAQLDYRAPTAATSRLRSASASTNAIPIACTWERIAA